MKHTTDYGEPWTEGVYGPHPLDRVGQTCTHEARIARSIACVNALAGISNPEAFVAKVRGVIAAWNDDEIGQIDGSLIEALEDMLPQENPNG